MRGKGEIQLLEDLMTIDGAQPHSHLGQIHSSESIYRHRELGEEAVHLPSDATSFPGQNDNLIGSGQWCSHLGSNLNT